MDAEFQLSSIEIIVFSLQPTIEWAPFKFEPTSKCKIGPRTLHPKALVNGIDRWIRQLVPGGVANFKACLPMARAFDCKIPGEVNHIQWEPKPISQINIYIYIITYR